MAWLLFIDESGHDRREAPYEVLAGIAIQDRVLWQMVNAIHDAEIRRFGRRYSAGPSELKGKKLLKRKVFRHAELNVSVSDDDIPRLAKDCLDDGGGSDVARFKALALAKIRYVGDVFDICSRFRCRAFASIVETNAPQTSTGGLRKDYAYLFQRFYYFLDDFRYDERGLIVFDELEKSRSHLLVDQTHRYFKETATGKARANLVIPEPLFVHSDLTTGIQVADLLAYTISWGFRTNRMTKPARGELAPYAQQIARLRHRSSRLIQGAYREIWSFQVIGDLRTFSEKELDDQGG